jgi:photosystem II stability/assembly factor-like uncharacterized protein
MVRGLDQKYMLFTFDLAADGNSILLGSLGDGIYKSENSGETWEKSINGLDTLFIDVVAVAPQSPDFAFAAGVKGGFYFSDNFGDSWQPIAGPFGKITAIEFLPAFKDHVLVGDDRGTLYKSTNGGGSWKVLYQTESMGAITAIAVSPSYLDNPVILLGTSAGGLMRLVHGDSLSVDTTLSLAHQPIMSIAFSPEFEFDGVVFVSSWNDGVYCTKNGGFNWQLCSSGLTRDRQSGLLGRPSFGRLSVSPNFKRDQTVFLASFDGMFRTEDGGRQWRPMETLSSLNIVGVGVSPNHHEDSTIAITTWMWGAYLSRDGGATYQPINRGAIDKPRENFLTRLFAVVFSPDYVADRTLFTSTWWRFLKSTDSGSSWSQIVPLDQPVWTRTHHGATIGVSPNFREDGLVFLGTHTGLILRSSDRGDTFEILKDVENMIGSIAISPYFAEDNTIFVGDTYGVHVSRDAGENWDFSPLVADSLHIDMPVSPAYPRERVEAWKAHQLLQQSKDYAVKLAFSNGFSFDGTAFAGTPNGLFRTQNHGQSWQNLSNHVLEDNVYIETIAVSPNFVQDQTFIISVRGRGHFRSSDGGKSFSEIGIELIKSQKLLGQYVGMIPKFPAIVYSPTYTVDKTIYGFSGPEIFKSVDNGDTWRPLSKPSINWQTRAWIWYLNNTRGSKRKLKVLVLAVILSVSLGTIIHRLLQQRR